MKPEVTAFRHAPSATFSYVVRDPESRAAAVIDPVMDYELRSGRLRSEPVDRLLAFCRERGLEIQWILETHAHADHVSAAAYIKRRHPEAQLATGEGILIIQEQFKRIFDLPADFPTDGSQFDRLLADGETFAIGALTSRVLATPGHTSDSVSFLIGDALFIGDTLFAPDFGSARCDFPGGDAGQLYDSVQKFYALPDETRAFLCHDYPPEGREARAEFSLGEHKRNNVHLTTATGRDEFISLRAARDANLPLPELIIPAVQLNINAGNPLPPKANGTSYLKVPLNVFPMEPPREPGA